MKVENNTHILDKINQHARTFTVEVCRNRSLLHPLSVCSGDYSLTQGPGRELSVAHSKGRRDISVLLKNRWLGIPSQQFL